jgi:ketosteroid isomerase-like protein
MKQVMLKYPQYLRIGMVLAFALTVAVCPAGAQKKDKNKNAQPTDPTDEIRLGMRAPDSQAIDQAIGEALGYWQIGDAVSLHRYYAEDVVMVSGAWEPPVIGWDNFLKAYQMQRAQSSGVRIDRSNTLIKVNGNSAWATYQFIYAAQVNGSAEQYRGHTTLLLAKQGDRWVITLNHSSVVDSAAPESSTSFGAAQPGGKH